jgi:Na+-translocating ferredoxin:NAD+ oxidoreductase subunit B
MSEDQAYLALVDHIRNWIFGMPDAEELLPLLRLLMAEDEAGFLARFPHRPHTAEQLSELLGVPAGELLQTMDPLIRKGLVCEIEGKSAVRYSFTDPIFFVYRMPGWKGETDEFNEKLATISNRYYTNHLAADFRGYPTKGLRAIPVAQTIDDPRSVLPYEDVLQVIDHENFFAVTHCACRHRKNLDPETPSCSHDEHNCLHFGKLAEYIVKYELGRKISREEAIEILKAAADAGLVHGISNMKTGMDTICNCCPCCCIFLERAKMDLPRGHQPSNYMLSISSETCQACGLCTQRCPVDALTLEGEKLSCNEDRCLGCGVCVHTCPTQSLTLRHKTTAQDFPKDMNEIARRFLVERRIDPSKVF